MFRPRRDPTTRNPMTEILKVPPLPQSTGAVPRDTRKSDRATGWSNRPVEPDTEKAKDRERDGEIETETEMRDNTDSKRKT